MRILYLTQLFSRTHGGGEYLFSMWAQELSKRGHQIFVISQRIVGIRDDRGMEGDVSVIALPPAIHYQAGLPPSIKDNILFLIVATLFGVRIVRENGIDIIHSNSYAPIFVGAVVALLTHRPHIATVHDIFSVPGKRYWRLWSQQSGVSRVSEFLGRVTERMAVNAFRTVIHTVSETSKQDILSLGTGNPVVVIPNAIELSLYEKPNGRSGSNVQVIFIGRHVFYKNLDVVLEAFPKVVEAFPDAKLVVVGDGPMKLAWTRQAERLGLGQDVDFRGYVSHEEKLHLLSKSAALVLPSLVEGFGIVILEAFAMKRPVLVSDLPPMNQIVCDGVDGYLLEPHDPDGWARGMIQVFEDPEGSSRMGLSGYEKVTTDYSISTTASRLEEMYLRYVQTV